MTGHRDVPDEEAVAVRVREALARIRELRPASDATPVALTVVSSLAEGADRLVAREVLAAGGELEVPLPLAVDDYELDFETETSKAEFRRLLERARRRHRVGRPGTREEAYASAGRYVADRSDVVIAVWDGEPARGRGGTAEVVEYVRTKGVPYIRIAPDGSQPIEESTGGLRGLPPLPLRFLHGFKQARLPCYLAAVPFRWLDEYNSARVSVARFERKTVQGREQLIPSDATENESLQSLAAWAVPHFVRADILAVRNQRSFLRLSLAQFLLATLAVAVVAAQTVFWPNRPELAYVEVGILAVLVVLLFLGLRLRIHSRWIFFRFLAERLRSAFYLAAAGVRQAGSGFSEEGPAPRLPPRRLHPRASAASGASADEWLGRTFSEAWNRRPHHLLADEDLPVLRDLLVDEWVGGQAEYHREKERHHNRRYWTITLAIVGIFSVTIAAAGVHAMDIWSRASGEGRGFLFVSIVLPAFGGALAGIRSQREYRRHPKRHQRMKEYLGKAHERVGDDLRDVADAHRLRDRLRDFAARIEAEMSRETGDWLGIVEFHNFELHV